MSLSDPSTHPRMTRMLPPSRLRSEAQPRILAFGAFGSGAALRSAPGLGASLSQNATSLDPSDSDELRIQFDGCCRQRLRHRAPALGCLGDLLKLLRIDARHARLGLKPNLGDLEP